MKTALPLSLALPAALVLLTFAAACDSTDNVDAGGITRLDASTGMGSGDGGTSLPDAGSTGADGGTMGMGGDGGTTGTNTVRLEIRDFTFAPANLVVPPGGTVVVQNFDASPHSVTSESAPNTFIPGSVSGISFDTGPFMGEAMFTLPANAPIGTVIPCYCTVHLSSMRNTCQVTIGTVE